MSSIPGRGSTFEILLPATRQVAIPGPSIPPPAAAFVGGGETVLVAEDDPAVRHTTVALLQNLGYRVVSAPGLEETLRLASEERDRLNLLLTDVVMPEISGKELYAKLKVSPRR